MDQYPWVDPSPSFSRAFLDRCSNAGTVENSARDKKIISASTFSIDFFRFPAEIRNQIMDLVLAPGHVHFPKLGKKIDLSRQGFQLLAANRQAYSEGHLQFYVDNTFHLPPGQLKYTRKAFRTYQLKHIRLIRSISVDCGVHDLADPETLRQISKKNHLYWPAIAGGILTDIWRRKLHYIRQQFPLLEELRVTFPDIDKLPWKDGQWCPDLERQQVTEWETTKSISTQLNTDYTVNGTVSIVLKGKEITNEIRGVPLDSDYEFQDEDLRLLAFTMAYTRVCIHMKLRHWEPEPEKVITWESMKKEIVRVAVLEESRLEMQSRGQQADFCRASGRGFAMSKRIRNLLPPCYWW